MRHHVRGCDRDEREHEVGYERAADAPELLRQCDGGEIGREHGRNEEHETGDVHGHRREVDRALRGVGEIPAHVRYQVLPVARPAEAVEARRAEHDRHEQKRAAGPVVAGQPSERPAHDHSPVPGRKGSDAREQREGDGEPLPVARPDIPAVDGHSGPGPVRVQRDRDRERARVVRLHLRELERHEREERSGGRVPPPLPGPLEHRTRLASSELEEPDDRVGDGPPGAERRPDVPEQDREERDAEPEDDVDERRREVEERDPRPEERGSKGEEVDPDGERTEHASHRQRKEDPAERMRKRASAHMGLEQRPPPEREQEDERDGEDEGGPDVEIHRGNRQVADDPDPVGEQPHGCTLMSAICTPLFSSSTSKRPGIVALNGSRTVPPAAMSRTRSIAYTRCAPRFTRSRTTSCARVASRRC